MTHPLENFCAVEAPYQAYDGNISYSSPDRVVFVAVGVPLLVVTYRKTQQKHFVWRIHKRLHVHLE